MAVVPVTGQLDLRALVLDTSASRLETIHVSAGRRGLKVEVAPADLLALTFGTFAPIARVAERRDGTGDPRHW